MTKEEIKKNWVIKNWIDYQFFNCDEDNYDVLLDFIISYWNKSPNEPPYTEHGIEHCIEVEKNIQKIVKIYNIKLNPHERFILSGAAYLHDISLKANWRSAEYNVFKEYENHHINSAKWLMNNYDQIHLSEPFASIISIIIKFHRRKENLKECPYKSILEEITVNPKLISALFRLADALHIDYTRVDKGKWFYLLYGAELSTDIKFHWIKSFLVPSILIDKKEKTINIQLNIPDQIFTDIEKQKETQQNVEFLGNNICQILQEEIDAINPILSKNSDFVATEVIYSLNKIPDYRESRNNLIRRFIFEYNTLYSPTASIVLETTLSNIYLSTSSYTEKNFSTEIDYKKYIEDLIESTNKFVEGFFKDRSCHVGLQNMIKIIGLIGEIVKNQINKQNQNQQELAHKLIKVINKLSKSILSTRKKNRRKIADIFKKTISNYVINDHLINILLFGNSSLIKASLKFLEQKVKDNITLYICECRGKTKYASNNRVSYSDAFAYSIDLKQVGFNNIKIIPDIAISKLFKNNEITLVLTGANGISFNGDCAHTIGHLAVANLARDYEVPLILVTDTFKIGNLVPNPQATRKDWYTTDLSYLEELNKNKIEPYCPREDLINISDIDYFVTEYDTYTPKQNKNGINDQLKNWYALTMTNIYNIIEDSGLKSIIGQEAMDQLKQKILNP